MTSHFESIGSRRPACIAAVSVVALALGALAPAASAQQPTKAAPRTGQEIVEATCARCHASGAEGAPRIGDRAAWQKRAEKGLTALTGEAINGIRRMPPHGGVPSLTDAEIRRATTYMVNQSGGHWSEPLDKSAMPAERSGEAVVRARCANCHQTGKGGAPRIGDRDAWIPRLANGLDPLVRSAINGHGGMPARGGMANLTDRELRNAIVYMYTPAAPAAR
jgi:cytochrome c5